MENDTKMNKKGLEGLKGVMVTFMLIGLFSFALIGFVLQAQLDNDATQTIASDPSLSNLNSSIYSNLDSFRGDVNDSENAFGNSEPITGGDSIQILSVAGDVWKNIVTVPKAMFVGVATLLSNTIFSGVSFGVVFGALSAMIVAIIILYAWRWIKTGQP